MYSLRRQLILLGNREETIHKIIFALANRYFNGDRSEAEELLYNVYEDLLSRSYWKDVEVLDFNAYMWTAIRNHVYKDFRLKKKIKLFSLEEIKHLDYSEINNLFEENVAKEDVEYIKVIYIMNHYKRLFPDKIDQTIFKDRFLEEKSFKTIEKEYLEKRINNKRGNPFNVASLKKRVSRMKKKIKDAVSSKMV